MAQNLSIKDLARETRSVFANELEFCDARKGLAWCDRAKGHNGKHAHGDAMVVVRESNTTTYWEASRIVRW